VDAPYRQPPPTTVCPWPPPPARPEATAAEVHVWCAALDPPAPHVERAAALLSADEQARAARFRAARDRRRYTIARGMLRAILGKYLATDPGGLEFAYGPRGKPELAGAGQDVQFNLSHSGELALCAVTRGRRVGVDLEQVRPLENAGPIARRFFAPAEVAAFEHLPEAAKLEGFFNCWTRKEAYIKALGDGLAAPLDQFTVSLIPGQPAALLAVEMPGEDAARWSVEALAPAPGYVGAVVVEGRGSRLRCWRYPAQGWG
jgi:4'-phosphopantetheinyl transferase